MRSEKGSVGTAEFSEDQRVVGDEESGDRHIDSLTALIGGRYFVIISCSLGSVLYAGPIPLTDPPAVTAKGAARVVTCAVGPSACGHEIRWVRQRWPAFFS